METPDKIKKGLEMCGVIRGRCKGCPYDGEAECVSNHSADALAYIRQLENRVWDLFDLLSSAWYGKGCYFKQEDGTVYSRVSGECMTFDQAIDEFAHELTCEREAEQPKWKNPDGSILCPYCGVTMRMISAWQKSMPDMGGYMWAARGKCPACGSITPEKHGRTAQEANAAAYAAAQWGRVPLPEPLKEG